MTVYISNEVAQAIKNASEKTGVEENLLRAFASVESDYGRRTSSRTGVQGLFQITGDTWKDIRTRHNLTVGYSSDFNDQAYTAALEIMDLQNKYKDRDLVAIAYNAGRGVANQVRDNGRSTQAIINAVEYFRSRGVAGFGPGKEAEVISYPDKIAKALGQSTAIGGSYAINNTTTNPPIIEADVKYDKEKPFINNLFKGNLKSCKQMADIPQETVNGSSMVVRIKASIAKG